MKWIKNFLKDLDKPSEISLITLKDNVKLWVTNQETKVFPQVHHQANLSSMTSTNGKSLISICNNLRLKKNKKLWNLLKKKMIKRKWNKPQNQRNLNLFILPVSKDVWKLWKELLFKMNNMMSLMITDITSKTELGVTSTNQKLIFVSYVESITKKPKERMLLAFVGIQDTKIFSLLVMVTITSNVKEEVVLFVFILLRTLNGQNICSLVKKVLCL